VTRVHAFYDQMCSDCGDYNYRKRTQTADLRGRVAVISGARVKIGYQAAIMLLRAGARVIVTTRFPRDAAERDAREKDNPSWADRLLSALDGGRALASRSSARAGAPATPRLRAAS
jgi:NAD(P)-dependent dehydrogenase (short-subunit alcohol dehydrogenase family)